MRIVFDPAKDAANRDEHGTSPARAADFEIGEVIEDDRRDYREARYRAFGFIDGVAHCLVFVVQVDAVRAISLRRTHAKEMKRVMASDPKEQVFDDENPEWTDDDFARARPAEAALSAETLGAFKPRRGPQRAPTKQLVSLRLSRDVLERFKATGPGWQTRIDQSLRQWVDEHPEAVGPGRGAGE